MNDDSSLSSVSHRSASPRTLGALRGATQKAGLDRLSSRLDELRAWLSADLGAIERELDTFTTPVDGDLAERAAAHLLGQRGKRIRPICALLGARFAGAGGDERVHEIAVASELVHAATLLHDDVIDDADERRGAAAARVVFGNSASILGGDYLLIEALQRVQRTKQTTVLAELLETIAEMVAAEALQLERRGTLDASREAYLTIVDGKTASLFRWALLAGGRLGTLGARQLAALGTAGMALGRAFQLVDDALDLEGDPTALGKDLFADLEQGKLTWPTLVAIEREPSLLVELQGLTKGDKPNGTDLAPLIGRIRATGAIEATRQFADDQARGAREALASLPSGLARDTFDAVITAATHRRA
ncbi:MAG: polyprenyl synthetase family protein [Deltaproteobacteria bacterium]|nr:polyprenyl synthetase family protein [Deltaproteobacteria bacterium]